MSKYYEVLNIEEKEFVEMIANSDEYDSCEQVKIAFGFFTLGERQCSDCQTCYNKLCCCLYEIGSCLACCDSLIVCKCINCCLSAKNFNLAGQKDVDRSKNFYEKLSLKNCFVNVFALRKFILNNVKTLREIEIENCEYYTSDKDAFEKQNETTNEYMLIILNFSRLISEFHFMDIMSIKITLLKKVMSKQNKTLKKLSQKTSSKVIAIDKSEHHSTIDAKTMANPSQCEQKLEEEARQLIKEFNCDVDCKFLKYELKQKDQLLRKLEKKNIVSNLIFDDFIDKKKKTDLLLTNMLSDIQQNLVTYKKYTKYALDDGKLAIIGDIFSNEMSLNQLHFLIQQNHKKIHGIIFKDNGKIPQKEFSDLIQSIELIPSLESITFLQSVLYQSSFNELLYLIKKKNVSFLNLYRSYFLKEELSRLFDDTGMQLKVNHYRFVTIDILQKKSYEFTPFSFDINELKQMKKDEMFEVQRIYRAQMFYPQQVYMQIVFFSGKNIAIIHNKRSEKILYKYWYLLNQTKEEQKLIFNQKQEELIEILEEQFKQDDVNLLNFSLIKLLIELVIEGEMKKFFEETLQNSKSFLTLQEKYELKLLEKVKFEKIRYLKTAHAYLYGFTRFKSIYQLQIFANNDLYKQVYENYDKDFEIRRDLNESAILKEIIKENDKWKKYIDLKNLKLLMLSDLSISNFKFLNELLPECTNLLQLSISNNQLNDKKMEGVDFSGITNSLEHLDIGKNKNLNNFSFLNTIFEKTQQLKVLNMQEMHLEMKKVKSIEFKSVSRMLEDLSFENNPLDYEITFLNDILENSNVKKLNLIQCRLKQEYFNQINFPQTFKEIRLRRNQSLNLAETLFYLGTQNIKLEYFEAFGLQLEPGEFQEKFKEYLQPNTLPGFSNLQRLIISNSTFSADALLMILNNQKEEMPLKEFSLSSHSGNFQFIQGLNLGINAKNILTLEFSYMNQVEDFPQILSQILKYTNQLKKISLLNSTIKSQSYLMNVPNTLEEVQFSRIFTSDIIPILNPILNECQNLKRLYLSNIHTIWQDQIDSAEFYNLGNELEEFDFSENIEVQEFWFLNDIFKKSPKLKILNLQKLNIFKSSEVDFDLISESLEIFNAQGCPFYDDEFIDFLENKIARKINIYEFELEHANNDKFTHLNYFGLFEQQNLSFFQFKERSKNSKEYKQKIAQEIASRKNNEELKDKEEIRIAAYGKDKNNAWSIYHKSKPPKNWVENEKDAQFILFANLNFYDSILQGLNQFLDFEVPGEETGARKIKEIPSQVITYQSVYNNIEYIILSLDKIQLNQTLKDNEFNFDMVKQLNLKNQKYQNHEFLSKLLERLNKLQLIDFSNMNLDLKESVVQDIKDCQFPQLTELNFSGNKCTFVNIFGFVNQILKNAPALQKLNLSNMDMNKDAICDFSLISQTLQELDISNNLRFQNLNILNPFFEKCINLRVLNISRININQSKLDNTAKFECISQVLEEFNMSENPENENIQIINSVIRRAKHLKKLNLSNSGITNQLNNLIMYYNISSELQELDLSKNSIFNFEPQFFGQILQECIKLEKINFGYQVSTEFIQTQSYEFNDHQLQDFDFSGNITFYSFDALPNMIMKSKQFRRLSIRNLNLREDRMNYLRFQEIGKFIQELDISENQELSIISDLNCLSEGNNFKVFIAQNTNLNEDIIGQLNIKELFKNITHLDLSKNVNFTQFEFFNQIFEATKQIEKLYIGEINIGNEQIKIIKFSLLTDKLIEFDFSGNTFLDDFYFLNDIFKVANKLKVLNLAGCDLNQDKLKNVEFPKLSMTIEVLDISKNPNLKQISFVDKFFIENSSAKLKILKITQLTYDISYILSKYTTQIEDIDCPFQQFQLEFFLEKNQVVEINIIKLVQHLNEEFRSGSCVKRSKMQMIFQGKDKKAALFKQLLEAIIEHNSNKQPLKTLLHFFFLILNDEPQQQKEIERDFFVMSPFSFFQQNQAIDFNSSNESFGKNKNSSAYSLNEEMILDAFNLAFFKFNLLNKKTEYIFGYTKFFFSTFTDFYVQKLEEEESSDLKFMLNLKVVMDQYGVKKAFLPIRLKLNPQVLKKYRLDESDVLQLVNQIPPATMILQDMSIQFVKSWYAINFTSPLSVNTMIDIKYEKLKNSSFAQIWALFFYNYYLSNYIQKGFISKFCQIICFIFYKLFSLLSSQPEQFRFDHTVIHLENQIKETFNGAIHKYLQLLLPIYLFVCIFSVVFFSEKLGIECQGKIPDNSYYFYGVYGLVTFIIEFFIFRLCINTISHLIPEKSNFPFSLMKGIKRFFLEVFGIDMWYLNYIYTLLISQLSRFDYFSKIAFLYKSKVCQFDKIFSVALAFLVIDTLIKIIFFLVNLFENEKNLLTYSIEKLCKTCNFIKFSAIADMVNIICPSNSIIIKKVMFNQVIISNLVFLIQDTVFIVSQMIVLFKGEQDWQMVISLISSGIFFILSFIEFLSITPSRVGQEAFNELSNNIKNRLQPNYLSKLSEIEAGLSSYSQIEMLKCLKSSTYFQKQFNTYPDLKTLKLRQISTNINFMKEFFGNSRVDIPFEKIADDQKSSILSQTPKFELPITELQQTHNINLNNSKNNHHNGFEPKRKGTQHSVELSSDKDQLISNQHVCDEIQKSDGNSITKKNEIDSREFDGIDSSVYENTKDRNNEIEYNIPFQLSQLIQLQESQNELNFS